MVQISTDIIYACIGGALIALGSSLNLLLKGKISGISGILYGFLTGTDFLWKFSFILGLLLSSSYSFNFLNRNYFESTSAFISNLSLIGFLLGGYLVGLGTKLGNGCTSGHGVCGLPRLSKRSIVACVVFLGVGVLTATFRAQVPFLTKQEIDLSSIAKNFTSDEFQYSFFIILNIAILASLIVILVKKMYEKIYDFFISLASGIIFGFGLIISGMVKRSKVINFLNLSGDWDPSLLFVLCVAVGINFVTFQLTMKKNKPVFGDKFELPKKTTLDLPLVVGAALFGIGWGISGLCPGPLIVNLFVYIPYTVIFFGSLVAGQFTAAKVEKFLNN